MIAVLSIVEIYPGREEAWRQVWQQTNAVQRTAEGFRTVRLFHDTTFVDLMVEILSLEGYDTLTYYQSEGTFGLLRDDQPDLINLDLWLERLGSGWLLVELLRLDPQTSGIPLIVCSADALQLKARAAWLEREGIPSLQKPFDLDELLRLVETSLQGDATAASQNAMLGR